MRKRFLFCVLGLFLCFTTQFSFAQTTFTLTNSSDKDRNEVVEVMLTADIYQSLPTLALYDENDNTVAYQALPYDNKIVFQAHVDSQETVTYTLKEGTPSTAETKTYAAIMMPATRGDIAWENDRSAYRMYNKLLLKTEPNSANGVDLWVKKLAQPIIQKMYTYADYHSEKAEGVDAYSVGGKTLGIGGIVAYVNNKLWLHDPFDECEIITNGPLRSEFILTYKKVLIDGDYYTKTVRITTNANGLLNKAIVKYEGKLKPMKIASGIFLHTQTNGTNLQFGNNRIIYAEDKSEGTVTSPNVRFYTAVYMPGETTTTTIDNQRIIYSDYAVGSEFTYYFGGGWNIFPAGEYTQDSDWTLAVNQFISNQQDPLLKIETPQLPTKKEVIDMGIRVNNYWIQTNPSVGNNLWARSVYNMGNIDFYKVYPDIKYLNHAINWAKSNNWSVSGGPSTSDADNHTCGQTYIDLYLMDEVKDDNKIKAIKAALDYRITNNPKSDDWWWIDAMLMAMPTLTRLGNVYEDTKYYDKMYALFANIRDSLVITSRTNLYPQDYRNRYGWGPMVSGYEDYCGLYEKSDHLWWRDWGFQPNVPPKKDPNNGLVTDVPKQAPSGKNIYWSRGNGWVLAAMARTLQLLPETDTHRDEYIEILQQMAAALKDCQREDGFWNMNLADATHFPGQETSGTILFTYGMAWAINNRLLDKETYYPVVAKAWNAVCKDAVMASGKLTKVQNVGEGPIDPNRLAGNVDFGVGAFLLAASEVAKLAPGEMPEAPEPATLTVTSVSIQNASMIVVNFDDELDPTSSKNKANYTLTGDAVIQSIYPKGVNSVVLALEKPLDYGKYTLTINDVLSMSGGTMEENSSTNFVYTVPLPDPQTEIKITAIGAQTGNPASNVMDKNLGTRWSQQGKTGQWIKFDLGKEVDITAVDIAFYLGDQRVSYFDIQSSLDNSTFTPVLSSLTSSGLTQELERFAFESTRARYIRIVCNSNSAGGEHWNSLTEVRIQYDGGTGTDAIETGSNTLSIYPNPVNGNYLIIDLNNNSNHVMDIAIYDTNGTNRYAKKMNAINGKINIANIELESGTYVLSVENDQEKVSQVFLVKH